MRFLLQVIRDGKASTLSVERGATLGRARNAHLTLDGAGVLERHAVLEPSTDGLWLRLSPGASVELNAVPLSASTVLRHGDELRVGDVRCWVLALPELQSATPRIASYDEWCHRLSVELRRTRALGLVLFSSPGLNGAARRAMSRRIFDALSVYETAWGEFAFDLLGGIICNADAEQLRALATQLPEVAGPRVTTAFLAVGEGEREALIGELYARLSPDVHDEPEVFIADDPAMLRLLDFATSLGRTRGDVCVSGPQGSGRGALVRAIARASGTPLTEHRGAPGTERGFQLVRDVTAMPPTPPGARLFCTSSTPLEGAAHNLVVLPLEARPRDIPLLAEHFLSQQRILAKRSRLRLSPELLPALLAWSWPGNVQELKNVMTRAARISLSDDLGRDILPAALAQPSRDEGLASARGAAERDILLETLARTRWNVTAAAQRLGVARRTIVYRMARLGLKRPARRSREPVVDDAKRR